MRSLKPFLLAVVAGYISLQPASALPVPKLPPEATDKPTVVVRVRPLDELMKDVAYIAKLAGQQDSFDAFKPGMEPVIDCIDGKKPIGFYAKIGPNGVDSYGVLMVPFKNQKETIKLLNNLLNQIGIVLDPGDGSGLHTINLPPFPIALRFHNGYVYATVKNTPEAEAALAVNKLYAPEALFQAGDDSFASVTFNADAIPNELKKKGLALLEEGLKEFKTKELGREPNAVVRNAIGTVVEELATKIQSLMVDTKTVAVRFDFDRVKEDMALNFRVTPRPDSDLANDFLTLGTSKSVAAGVLSPNAPLSISGHIAAPASIKKALDPVIDQVVGEAWKKAKPGDEQAIAKELAEALAPTLRAGVLDFAAELRGPNAKDQVTFVAAVNVKDADRLDGTVRKVYGKLPEAQKQRVKLDVEKAGGVGLHQMATDIVEQMYGPDPKAVAAFRKDAVVVAIGQPADAQAAVLGSLESTTRSVPVLEGKISIRKFAPVMEKKDVADVGAVEAAKRAFPAGTNDEVRMTVVGGQNLDVRFTGSTRLIQFTALLEQARRAR